MKAVNIVFPNQLYLNSPLVENKLDVYLIEEQLFFSQYKFHKQKIAFHRASMKSYQNYLESMDIRVHYIEANDKLSAIQNFQKEIEDKSLERLNIIEPTDDWLLRGINSLSDKAEIQFYTDPQFLNDKESLSTFFRADKKSFFQTSFYKQQRKSRSILMSSTGEPEGGKWTYDDENRKKYPKSKTAPAIHFPERDEIWNEAVDYCMKNFKDNPGELSNDRVYPVNHHEANAWIEQFLVYRFHDFGSYEDAIVKDEIILNHSLLSPLLNAGLILPNELVSRSIEFAARENIPINSTEGFVRQIIGWREFIRGMYICKGGYSRSKNFWSFSRKIPKSFYDGSTGIAPVDDSIKKVLKTGYCHHIERLMILGNFMLLCEFDPDEVYQWFMELFIDAYDWVMVPNVYGMSQFADGGTFATKPYIAGSNYIRKMSNYPKGDWEPIWDALFWRFIMKHSDFFASNPRTSMLLHSLNRMSDEKRAGHMTNAESFISTSL